MKPLLPLFLLLFSLLPARGQDFLNNDLWGQVFGPAILPVSWQAVPFSDPACLASTMGFDTPDLTNTTGPVAFNGTLGNPYSGSTFVSGAFQDGGGGFLHEGIQQQVTGFTVGCTYAVNFQQAVVKQSPYLLDTAGGWAVYADNALVGVTPPTVSYDSFASTSFAWEFRSLTFTATAATHVMKFLPADDDTDQLQTNPMGGLRMGIDSIYLQALASVPAAFLGGDTTLCPGQVLALDATTPNGSYLWQDGSTSAMLTVTQAGTYAVTVTDLCGTSSDAITVNYHPLPVANLGNDTTLCPGQVLPLDVSMANAGYVWQDGSTNGSFTVTQAGTYHVTVTTACGIARDTVVVNYRSLPAVDFGPDTTLCAGQVLVLNATTPAAAYLWQDGSVGAQLAVTLPGTYHVQVTTLCGTATDTINVAFLPLPGVDLGPDTALCPGQNLVLDASALAASYTWSDGSSGAQLAVSQPGTYWVAVSDGCGTARDTIIIGAREVPQVALGMDTVLCAGQALLLDASTDGDTYLWQNGALTSGITVTQPGIYAVLVTNACGAAADTIAVAFEALPTVDLGADTTACLDDRLRLLLSAPAGATYRWQDGSTASGFTVTQPGTYHVAVTDRCGTATDSLTVRLADCDCQVYLPNAFTPNGDGRNEVFGPIADCVFSSYSFVIHARNGAKVFESFAFGEAWDGTYQGALVPSGAYAYELRYRSGTQDGKRIGTVVVIR